MKLLILIYILNIFIFSSPANAEHTVTLSSSEFNSSSCRDNIDAAVTEVENAGGGTVFLPEGSCSMSGYVSVRGNVTIIGQGKDKTDAQTG